MFTPESKKSFEQKYKQRKVRKTGTAILFSFLGYNNKNVNNCNVFMLMFLKSFAFFQTPHQLKCNFIAFNPHHSLLGTAIAKKFDAAVSNGFLVDDGKFLVDVRFKKQVDS